MKKVLYKVLTRLKEKSTWAGIALLATAAFKVDPVLVASYVDALPGIAGFLLLLMPEETKK